MRRASPWLLVLVVAGCLFVAGQRGGPPSDATRVQRLSEALRCPVCDGLAVADSPSSTARAIAADIRDRVARGESDADIRDAYVIQYGKWILLEPPGGGIGMVAWGLPAAALVVAASAAVVIIRRRALRAVRPSAGDRARVDAAIARGASS